MLRKIGAAGIFLVLLGCSYYRSVGSKNRSPEDQGTSKSAKDDNSTVKSVDVGNPTSKGSKSKSSVQYETAVPHATVPLKISFNILEQSANEPIAIRLKKAIFFIKDEKTELQREFLYINEPIFGFGNQTDFVQESLQATPLYFGDEITRIEIVVEFSEMGNPNVDGVSLLRFVSKKLSLMPNEGTSYSVGTEGRLAFTVSRSHISLSLQKKETGEVQVQQAPYSIPNSFQIKSVGTFEVTKN